MCGLFPCIPLFRRFILLKSVKKCACVIMLKIALLLVKNVFFGLNEGINEKVAWIAQKHTANNLAFHAFSANSKLQCVYLRYKLTI